MIIKRSAVLLSLAFVMAGCSSSGKSAGNLDDSTAPAAPMDQEEEAAGKIPTGEEEGPLKNIYFAFDSSALSAESQSTLKQNQEWIKANPNATFVIEGHCDERGTNEYNLALGERRAKAVQAFYKKLGVAATKMSTISYGEEVPLDPGHNEAAWAKNRRAHHKVTQ